MSPKKDEATATVSVRLGENMKKILEAIAYEERRTVSSLLGRLIDSYVGTYSPKNIARALQALRQREQEPSEVPIDVIMKEVERLQQPAPSAPSSSFTVAAHDKITAEAQKRIKDGTFTQEEAYRFILEAKAEERLKDGTFTEEEARQFVKKGELRWGDRDAILGRTQEGPVRAPQSPVKVSARGPSTKKRNYLR